MKLEEIEQLPIKNITGAWKLKNGDLYLIVKCSDGIERTIILEMKKK
jgi:hypothetical protein